jgi:protein arginine N-methyltransferase 1
MIADSARMEAFVQALRRAIRPESVVLDIGTGTGIFALLSCQLGARQVYAIEPNDPIQIAREIAAANGYAERIQFIQNVSTKVTLPEQADVIISDLRGVLPFSGGHLPSITDARRRFLVPGGVLIPLQDTLWVAVVEAADSYGQHYTTPWEENKYSINMDAARYIVTNSWHKERVRPDQLLVESQCWTTLDYASIESPDVSSELTWDVSRTGTAHGFVIWFDAVLTEGIEFSNAPGKPELIYGNAFFPFSKPVSLTPSDTICISLDAKLVSDDYIWRWNTLVLDQGDPDRVKANFKQSTFFGAPLSLSNLRKQASTYAPKLHEDGEVICFILSRMDGQTSLDDIAHKLSAQFPDQFPTWERALDRVSEMSKKYSR